MLRTLGFLSGVGLSIAGFLLVLEPAEVLQLQAKANTVLGQILPPQPGLSESYSQQPRHASSRDDNHPAEGHTVPQQSSTTTSAVEQPDAAGDSRAHTPAAAAPHQGLNAPATAAPHVAPAEPSGGTREQLFWNPFRSELAAQGFAGRLSSATDVEVRVIQAGPASYRVGFVYRDEAERRALIERIESITGLELK